MLSAFMKRSSAVLAAAALTIGALSAADVLTQLGITPAAAKEALMSGIGSGWLDYGIAASAFKKAPVALRVELAQGAIAWAKTYTGSADFKAAYAKLRETQKPDAPVFVGTPEEEQARQHEQDTKERVKAAEEMKPVLASMPPEQRKAMEAAIQQAAAAAKQMDTPEMRKMVLDGIRMRREEKTRTYKADLATWQEQYPESPAPVIAKRLKAFLDLSASVDFDAKLQPKNGKMYFVNESYESKSSEWKACYRAGKEPVAAARAAAEAWMKELGR